MKRKFQWLCLGLAIVSSLGLIWQRFRGLLLAKLFLPKEAASIGIIGGADGPTAIFITSKLSPSLSHILLYIGLVAGIVGFFVLRKRQQR